MKIEDKVEQDERIIIATRSDGSSQHRVIYYDELNSEQKEFISKFNESKDGFYVTKLRQSLINVYNSAIKIHRDSLRGAVAQ